MKKKLKKERKPRLSFAEKLAVNLGGIGIVETGDLYDKEGGWVEVRIGDMNLCFSFDNKREKIESIGLFKDVVEVTGQKKIWGV